MIEENNLLKNLEEPDLTQQVDWVYDMDEPTLVDVEILTEALYGDDIDE